MASLFIAAAGRSLRNRRSVSPISRAALHEAIRPDASLQSFYGTVEQVGSVSLEGDDGYLYPPNFADVIVRDPYTFEEVPHGQTGVLEVLSALPRSYPGHCLLTEDLGVVHAVDSSACGRLGQGFLLRPRPDSRGRTARLQRRHRRQGELMQIEMLLPQQRVIALEELRSLLAGGAAAEPFHASVVDASIDLSQRIFHDPEARGYPELLALAY